MRYLTDAEVDRVATLTREGRTIREISEIIGRPYRTVSRARKRAGVAKPVARHMSPEDVARAQEMLDDGCSQQEVARTLGFGNHAIARRFPGQCWTREEIVQHAVFCRRNRKLLR